jgi:uncharacterized protein (TIGR03083 family)
MKIFPRYEGPPMISIEGDFDGQLAPTVRQRRRLEKVLASLSEEQWAAPSRCAGWAVSDVVAHLIIVNTFWTLSISKGLRGKPTRYLDSFDPAVTPDELIGDLRGTPPLALLDRFTATNDGLFDLVGDLDEAGWSMLAECPVGHLPIRLVLQHGLWDCWVHERDITLALGLPTAVEADEVISALVYASALSPAFALTRGDSLLGQFALATSDPVSFWVLDVTDNVVIRAGGGTSGAPRLSGDAVELAEALSLRLPIPAGIPNGWRPLLAGLEVAFNADSQSGSIEPVDPTVG